MASIEKRGENSWRLTVELGFDTLGNRIRERKSIKVEDKTLLRAPKRLQEYLESEWHSFKKDVEAGEFRKPEKMKFTAFAEIWRNDYAKSQYSPRTYKNYVDRLDSHVLPYFERLHVDEITPKHVLDFKNYLDTPEARKDGKPGPLAKGTQLFIFKVLAAMLDCATNVLKIIKQDPSASISPPKVPKNKKQQKDVYSEKEAVRAVVALLSYVQLWRLYFFGAMFGGYRRGELLALEWPKVDFGKNRIWVDKSISWTENGVPAISSTKEENEEWVSMPKWYMRDLENFYLSWRKDRLGVHDDDWYGGKDEAGNDKYQFVFHNGRGKPYYHDTPTHTWRRFLKRNGLRHIKLHGLRHTAATLLAEDGVSLSLIQGHLRHESSETTDEFYSHFTEKASRAVADHFEKFDPQLLGAVGTNWGQESSPGSQIHPFSTFRKKKKPL